MPKSDLQRTMYFAAVIYLYFLIRRLGISVGVVISPLLNQGLLGTISPELKQPGRDACHSPQSTDRLRMRRAILRLPQYSFIAAQEQVCKFQRAYDYFVIISILN